MNRQSLQLCSVCLVLVLSLGCEQALEQINSTPPQAPPPVAQPVQKQTPVEPEPIVEAPPQEPEPPSVQPVEPMVPPRKALAPEFAGSIRRLITPKFLNGKRGAHFSVVTALKGDELHSYSYQIEIRDQSGASIIFPLEFSDDRVVLNEFIPQAGVKERYDYQIMYLDPTTNDYVPLREDNWGHFNVEDD